MILDFGTDIEGNREEFLRCSTKIVIGGSSEWDIQKLISFMQAAKAYKGSDSWVYFIPRASDKVITRIRKEVNRKNLGSACYRRGSIAFQPIKSLFQSFFS